ncbi:AZG1 [Symbiodinium sp. CCMP2592]|nr:AZG1 [Symbiodinium sp. CCMP2592]
MGAASQSESGERTVVKQGARRASMLEILGLKGNFSHLNLKDPFNVKKLGSSYTTEIRAGLTTFLAMAYILPVNSGMLSLAVPDMKEQLVCATALAAFCGCWLMGILSNFPFMLAPGMGTNAYFTFSIVLGRGLPWQAAFAAVFVAGCLFTLLSVTGMRTLLIRLFPEGIKEIIGAGVGLFLTFIAFQSAEGMGFSVADPATLVKLGSLSSDSYDSAKMWLSLAVLVITASLLAAKVPGAPLIGIVLGTVICWIEGWAHGTEGTVFGYPFGTGGDSSAKDFHIYVPTGIVAKPSLEGLAGALFEGFDWAFHPDTSSTFWTAVATFCYTDLLDSSGTFFAVAKVAGLTDSRGNLPLARQNMAYLADALAMMPYCDGQSVLKVGSVLGVSTVSTFAESTAGVADGAKTGLASLVTGSCFLLAIPFSPIVSAVPPLASGPIPCLLGAMMCSSVKGVDWDDFQESLPAFVAMITMPFTFSIGYGIIAGLGLWISIQLLLAPLRLYRGESPMVRVHKLWGSAFVEGDEEEKSSGKGTPSTITPGQSFGGRAAPDITRRPVERVSKAPEQAPLWILCAHLTMGAASQSESSERTVVKQGARRASMLEILGLKGNFSHLNLKDPFNVKKLGSSYTTEIRAGLTTFLAMAYILPVNSGMLSLAVPDMKEQLVCATALAAFCGCWLMGILSNFPFMLAPGMGTNAYFTFSIVLGRGLPWQAAFAAVFVAGCLFTLLSVTGMRTLLIRLFPEGIKEIIGAGVGLFLTFIAFQSAEGMGFSVADPATLVKLGSLSSDSYDSAKLWLSLAVLVITASLLAAKVPGAPLIGIVLGTVICWIEGWAHGTEGTVFGYPFGTGGDSSAKDFRIYVPTGIVPRQQTAGRASATCAEVAKPSLEGLAGALFEGFDWAFHPDTSSTFWTAVATFCHLACAFVEAALLKGSLAFGAIHGYTDLLDSSGTFFAVAKVAGLTDSRGNLPLARQNMAYLADALAMMVGSVLGVSTVSTFAESTAGVADGAKTGLASLVTGSCFLLAIPFSPIVSAVPPLASGPILCLLGAMMCSSVKGVDWDDFQESLPAFVAMITMPFTFSIGYGIIAGLGLWISIQLLLAPLRLYRGESPMVRVHKLWGSAFVEGDEEEKISGKGTPSTITPSQSFGEEV